MPLLPVVVPGAADSPGNSSCNLVTTPAFTVIGALVTAGIVTLLVSEAVTVRLPAVLNVRLNARLPLTNAPFAGRIAFGSLEVMAMVSFVLMMFQKTSTAFTVALKAVPADCASGLPVLPETDPGAAVSPGRSSCN